MLQMLYARTSNGTANLPSRVHAVVHYEMVRRTDVTAGAVSENSHAVHRR